MTPESQELLGRWPLAASFNLQFDHTAVIAGAYKGAVLELLHDLYPSARFVGYEPQLWAYKQAVERCPYATIFPVALGTRTGLATMGEYGTDAASFNRIGEKWRVHEEAVMVDARVLLSPYPDVELFVCNMEGYEFELLHYLRSFGWLSNVKQLALQFHFGLGNDDSYQDIQNWLQDTHECVERVGHSWEHWRLK